LLAVELGAGVSVLLAVLSHRTSVSTPIDCAVPATIRIACSTSHARWARSRGGTMFPRVPLLRIADASRGLACGKPPGFPGPFPTSSGRCLQDIGLDTH